MAARAGPVPAAKKPPGRGATPFMSLVAAAFALSLASVWFSHRSLLPATAPRSREGLAHLPPAAPNDDDCGVPLTKRVPDAPPADDHHGFAPEDDDNAAEPSVAPAEDWGEAATAILVKRPEGGHDGGIATRRPLRFRPGSLSMTPAEALRHCFADPEVYAEHFRESRSVSLSRSHKLAYLLIPKSGSSTGRHMMKEHFDAAERKFRIDGREMEGVELVTFVRDPLSRFFSQYDETYVRTAPWQNKARGGSHPFPFLYANISSYHDYEDVFCPPETRTARRDCVFRKSQENGTLASRFERFVHEWDGRHAFDVHLHLQVPMLSYSSTGLALNVSRIYNSSDAEAGWRDVARRVLGNGSLEVIRARSYPRRFDPSLVSGAAKRRACELALLDYCCLNLELPGVCRGAGRPGERELFCRVNGKGRIEPGILPGRGGRRNGGRMGKAA